MAFAIYGKRWEHSRAAVLDEAKLKKIVRECAMGLGLSARTQALRPRSDWPADDPGLGPGVSIDTPFVARSLLIPEEDGDTAQWVVRAVKRARDMGR